MKAFVIYLPQREHSVAHATNMVNILKSYNLEAKLFKGTPGDTAVQLANKQGRTVYPYSIKSRVLSDNDVKELIKPEAYENFKKNFVYSITEKLPLGDDADKVNLPGVIGCFYSHYSLWEKCVNLDEPIMIFEDDVKFFRGWLPIEWDDILVLSLGKNSFLSNPWQTYLENPTGNPQPITWRGFSMPGASGYAINPRAAKSLVKFYNKFFYPADNAINQHLVKIQVHNYLMGRNTLPEEGNISMTRSKDWQ
jgi:hypothetical protein